MEKCDSTCLGWCWLGDGNGIVHVFPINDYVYHVFNSLCMCGPKEEVLESGGRVYTHASLDGREIHE